jgi:sec-independent protein translocase protein TatA
MHPFATVVRKHHRVRKTRLMFGIPELLIVLVIVLLVLGPKRLPALGRSLGGGIRGFRDSIKARDERDAALPSSDEPEALDGEVVRDRRP